MREVFAPGYTCLLRGPSNKVTTNLIIVLLIVHVIEAARVAASLGSTRVRLSLETDRHGCAALEIPAARERRRSLARALHPIIADLSAYAPVLCALCSSPTRQKMRTKMAAISPCRGR